MRARGITSLRQNLPPSLKRPLALFRAQLTYTTQIIYYRLRFRHESVFSVIHRKRSWGGTTASGGGSDQEQTHTIRDTLPLVCKELGVRSMLDAPCGDFYWMSQTMLDLDHYIGVDIVEPMINQNQRRYGSDKIRFLCLDLTKDPLPKADLIFCRDCMVHMSNADIALAVQNFKRSGAEYLFATTYPGIMKRNRTILTGMWRPIDLEQPPFNFPAPLKTVNENTTELTDYPRKSLGLWRLEDIHFVRYS